MMRNPTPATVTVNLILHIIDKFYLLHFINHISGFKITYPKGEIENAIGDTKLVIPAIQEPELEDPAEIK